MRKKLHIICGSCGSNGDLNCVIEKEYKDVNGVLFPDAIIKCDNCGVVNSISDVMTVKPCFDEWWEQLKLYGHKKELPFSKDKESYRDYYNDDWNAEDALYEDASSGFN